MMEGFFGRQGSKELELDRKLHHLVIKEFI